jgi:hypothetical protein
VENAAFTVMTPEWEKYGSDLAYLKLPEHAHQLPTDDG